MKRVNPEEILHIAVCQAVGLMNGALVFAQSEEGQQVRNVLRKALVEYADVYMDQPVTEAERNAMILGHANSAAVSHPDDCAPPPQDAVAGEQYAEGWNDCRDSILAMLAARPQGPAPAVDVEAVREVIAEMHRERKSTDGDYYHELCGKQAEEWANQLARAIGDEK